MTKYKYTVTRIRFLPDGDAEILRERGRFDDGLSIALCNSLTLGNMDDRLIESLRFEPVRFEYKDDLRIISGDICIYRTPFPESTLD